MKKILPYLSIVTAMLIWAGAGIAVKSALEAFAPMTLIVLRFTLAVVLMLVVGLIFRSNDIVGLQRVDRRDLPLFVLGGLFQPFLYFILETYTYQTIPSPTIAEALLSMQPVLAPLFALVLLRERVTRNNVLGIVVSTIGVLMLLLLGNNETVNGAGWGMLLAFLTVCMSVSYTVVLRKIPARYSPLTIVFHVQLVALLLFYVVWGICEPTASTEPVLHDAKPLLAVGYLAVFASVAAFVLFCYTVRKIGVTSANVFNNVRPIFTALMMWLLFGEMLPWGKLVGIGLIIIGLFISQKYEKDNIF